MMGGGLPLDGVGDVIEAEQAALFAELNGDEVNAPRLRRAWLLLAIRLGDGDESLRLGWGDALLGRAGYGPAPGADLDKDQGAALLYDEIHLAGAAAIVPRDDLIFVSAEVRRGQRLAAAAQTAAMVHQRGRTLTHRVLAQG